MADITPNPNVEALFLRHMAAVRGFVFGMLCDHSAADDVLQEVFVVVKEQASVGHLPVFRARRTSENTIKILLYSF